MQTNLYKHTKTNTLTERERERRREGRRRERRRSKGEWDTDRDSVRDRQERLTQLRSSKVLCLIIVTLTESIHSSGV